jgi:hypothetical protein
LDRSLYQLLLRLSQTVVAFDCNVQVVQIVAKAQAASEREVIATIVAEINPKQLEILAKKPSILAPPKEVNVK